MDQDNRKEALCLTFRAPGIIVDAAERNQISERANPQVPA